MVEHCDEYSRQSNMDLVSMGRGMNQGLVLPLMAHDQDLCGPCLPRWSRGAAGSGRL